MKRAFFLISIFVLFFSVSCSKNDGKLNGRWTSPDSGAIYEFSKNTFVLNTTVLNSSIMVRGNYRVSKGSVDMVAKEVSFDFGETWKKNDGSLIPCEKMNVPLEFRSEEKIILADNDYIKF